MLQEIVESLQNLHLQVNQLTLQTPQVNPQPGEMAAPSPRSDFPNPAASAQPLRPHKEPFVPAPEPYAGDLGPYVQFILNCSLVFELQPSSDPSDRAKIDFVNNLLRRRAAKWATALWSRVSPVLSSFESFTTELRKVFITQLRGERQPGAC